MTATPLHDLQERRMVLVEDHNRHIRDFLAALHARQPQLLGQLTVVSLAKAGTDTDGRVVQWLEAYPGLQVAARLSDRRLAAAPPPAHRGRMLSLGPGGPLAAGPLEVWTRPDDFCRFLRSLLSPGGLLLMDVQLETLEFVDQGQYWQTVFRAAAVRGSYGGGDPPVEVLLITNKERTEDWEPDLASAGFALRDVFPKEQWDDLVDLAHRILDEELAPPPHARGGPRLLAARGGQPLAPEPLQPEPDWNELSTRFDVLRGPVRGGRYELRGRRVRDAPRVLHLDQPEGWLWSTLLEHAVEGREGVPWEAFAAVAGTTRGRPKDAMNDFVYNARRMLADGWSDARAGLVRRRKGGPIFLAHEVGEEAVGVGLVHG